MSTALDTPEASSSDSVDKNKTEYLTADGQANVALLQDRTPQWLRATPAVGILTIALGILFVLLSYTRLWHTDLWGHLTYGKWIWEHRQIPDQEPLMPLAQGTPFVDTAWLSQLIGLGMMERFGVSGIQFLYAATIVGCAALLTFAVYLRTRHLGAALLTLVFFYWGEQQQLVVVRPQLAGMLCYTLVLVLATSKNWQRWYSFAIPVLFAVWANLHGSFVIGLGLLGALTLGRLIDVYRRSQSWQIAFSETRVRQLFYATEFSAIAALLNPYGIGVYPEVLAVASHANLNSLIEWMPMTLRMKQGQAAAVIGISLILLYRSTPRRVSAGEVLLLLGLGLAALWTSRMIVWWVPVAAYFLAIHLAACWKVWRPQPVATHPGSGLWSVVVIGIAWIAFAYTPFGYRVLHGGPKTPEQQAASFRRSVSARTPVQLTEYLRNHPPQGQVFNAYEWGDYLLWAGPQDMKIFVNSHAHLVPEEVWQDYLLIANAGRGWESRLNHYGVNTIIVDEAMRSNLIRELERMPDWEQKYKDNVGSVFFRKNPI